MAIQTEHQDELEARDERLIAMLSRASRKKAAPARDWIAFLLQLALVVALVGGAAVLWMLY